MLLATQTYEDYSTSLRGTGYLEEQAVDGNKNKGNVVPVLNYLTSTA
jgi:hypothetical protein